MATVGPFRRVTSAWAALGLLVLLWHAGPEVAAAWPSGLFEMLLGSMASAALFRWWLESLYRAMTGREIWGASR